MPKANEESLEIVFAGLMDFAALEMHIIDDDLPSGNEPIEIDAQRAYVLREIGDGFLKSNQSARLAELLRPTHEEFDTEQCLTGASTARDERGATLWQAAKGDFIESGNTRG